MQVSRQTESVSTELAVHPSFRHSIRYYLLILLPLYRSKISLSIYQSQSLSLIMTLFMPPKSQISFDPPCPLPPSILASILQPPFPPSISLSSSSPDQGRRDSTTPQLRPPPTLTPAGEGGGRAQRNQNSKLVSLYASLQPAASFV
jgi:hypothetical protein